MAYALLTRHSLTVLVANKSILDYSKTDYTLMLVPHEEVNLFAVVQRFLASFSAGATGRWPLARRYRKAYRSDSIVREQVRTRRETD